MQSDIHPSFPTGAPCNLVGRHPAWLAVLEQAARVAPTRLSVLLTGESGTGKELLARLIHDRSGAARGPFVTVNCGALPRELAESELFGHERGAFTGAAGRRVGVFEEADGGTLVLDEIGELPLDLQPKLLRVLETGRLRRVGGSGDVPIRTRVVAATLRDLRREASTGGFRLDLFHRIGHVELRLPPLRERRADIPLLIERFLDEARGEHGPLDLAPAALARLVEHPWPGNVRELRNTIARAAALAQGRIEPYALGLPLPPTELGAPSGAGQLCDAPSPDEGGYGDDLCLRGLTWAEIERSVYERTLARHGHCQRRAAEALGLSRSTFNDRVLRLGLGTGRARTRRVATK